MSEQTWECERASTEHGPDYCKPCSNHLQEWVPWEGHQSLVRTVAYLRAQVEQLQNELRPRW